MQTMIKFGVELATPRIAIDENLVRQSLIDAIALIEKHSKGLNWFKLNSTAQNFALNAQRHLNNELNALLRGTYMDFLVEEKKTADRRSKNVCA